MSYEDDLRKAEFIKTYFGRCVRRIKSVVPDCNDTCRTPVDLFGCTMSTLAAYIEQWFPKMSKPDLMMRWSNYGLWEVDHIQPVSSFQLCLVEAQAKCFFMLNLRPMWRPDNMRRKRSPESECTFPTDCLPEEQVLSESRLELSELVTQNIYLDQVKKARIANSQLLADVQSPEVAQIRKCSGLYQGHDCPSTPHGKSLMCRTCRKIHQRFYAWRKYTPNNDRVITDYLKERSITLKPFNQ